MNIENIVGKGKNAQLEQFLIFPQCFIEFFMKIIHQILIIIGFLSTAFQEIAFAALNKKMDQLIFQ